MDYSQFEEPVKFPGKKKNTKNWCKGKVGHEHIYEIEVDKSYAHRSTVCYWPEWSIRLKRPYWWCKHIYVCQRCKKYKELDSIDCPEFKELHVQV